VLQLEGLVFERHSLVDGDGSRAVPLEEVSSLQHEILDHAVERRTLVAERHVGLAVLSSAEFTEVLARLRHHVREQLHHDAARVVPTDGHVEEHDLKWKDRVNKTTSEANCDECRLIQAACDLPTAQQQQQLAVLPLAPALAQREQLIERDLQLQECRVKRPMQLMGWSSDAERDAFFLAAPLGSAVAVLQWQAAQQRSSAEPACLLLPDRVVWVLHIRMRLGHIELRVEDD